MRSKKTRNVPVVQDNLDRVNAVRNKLRASLPALVSCETLEKRQMLSVTASYLAGTYLVQGNSWTYHYTETAGNGTTTVDTDYTFSVIGNTSFNSQSVTQVNVTAGGNSTLITKQYRGFDGSNDLVFYGEAGADGDFTETDTFSPYQVDLPASLSYGTPVTHTDTDTDVIVNGNGTVTSTETNENSDVVALVSATPVTVTVPAGTFTNAYEVSFTETSTPSGNDTGDSTVQMNDTWYVPGTGVVKITADNETDGNSELFELTSDNVAGDHLDFTVQPTDTMSNDTIDPAVVVSALNNNNDVDIAAAGNITLTLNNTDDTQADLTGTLTEPLVNGVATFSDLSIDNTGSFTLTATDDGSNPSASSATSDSFNVTGVPVTTPTAPTGLAATKGTLPKHVEVTWNSVVSAATYQVFRGTSAGSLAKIAAGITTTSYADTSAVPGVDYFYSVRAVNVAGIGPVASPAVTGYKPLAAPTNLAATDNLPKHIAITWTAVPNAASYQVFRGTNASNETKIASGITTTGYADLTAVQGVIYDYSVRAVNSLGLGITAGPVTGFKCLPAPTNLTATDDLSNEVTLNWDGVSGATGYQVFRSTTDNFAVATNISGTISALTFNDTSAGPDTLYYYWVRARNPGDIGADDGPSTGERT
jgi:fibronectin type 3 domain-containing protein